MKKIAKTRKNLELSATTLRPLSFAVLGSVAGARKAGSDSSCTTDVSMCNCGTSAVSACGSSIVSGD